MPAWHSRAPHPDERLARPGIQEGRRSRDEEPDADDQCGREPGVEDGVGRLRDKARGQPDAERTAKGRGRKVSRRGREADDDRDETEAEGEPAAPTGEKPTRHGLLAAAASRIAASATGEAFQPDEEQDAAQDDEGDLRRAGQVRAVHPGCIDLHGEGANPEEFGRADIVDRFHQRESGAERDRRAGQGQRDAEKAAGGPCAEHRAASSSDPARIRNSARVGR